MSLFNSQTIFSLLITLLIGVALYYYVKYKYRVLELTQREQAKVLQGVIMSMNSNNQNIMSMLQNKSQEEVISEAVNNDINRFNQVNSTSELIDVSDDSDSDESSDSGSDDSSESNDSGSDESSEGGGDHDNAHEVTDNNKRKILFTGSNDSHLVEHLDGPDVKVIELTHPLYPKNNSEEYNNKGAGDDDDADDDADEDEDDDDEDSDSESLSDLDGPHEPSGEDDKHEIHEIREIREIKENVVIKEMNTQNTQHTQNTQIDLETDNISEVISVDNSLDNLSVKTVFKTKDNNKDSETHSDYNSMNVQSLRQLLKNKLSTEGTPMSESSINKLTKKT